MLYNFSKKIIQTIVFTSVLTFFPTMAQGSIDSSFLKQMRVLSESRGMVWKSYKGYIMIGIKNSYKDPEATLKASIKSFESAMTSIDAYGKEHKLDIIFPFLKEAEGEWVDLKKILLALPAKDKINDIDKKAMKLTRTIIKVLKAMGSYDKSGNWKYLEQTQKAQNIAQRMATLYLDNVWGALDSKRYDKMMTKVVGNYTKVEKLIYSSKFLTPEIEDILKNAQKDFLYFKMMWKSNNNVFIPALIYKKSSDMDSKMGECTALIMNQI